MAKRCQTTRRRSHLVRDRDGIYGFDFRTRGCLDQMIIFGEDTHQGLDNRVSIGATNQRRGAGESASVAGDHFCGAPLQ